jgi:hypothetical protein
MKRASACFNKAGIDHDIFPVNFYGKCPEANFVNLVVPSETSFGLWVLILHETVGYVVYKIMGYC